MSPLPPRFRFRPAPRLTSWVLGVLLLLGGPTRALDVPHEHPAPSSGSFAAHDSLIRDFVAAPNGTVPLKNFTGQVREFTLEVHETMSEITPGVRVKQWAFGFPGQPPSVPGPELRVKVGDLVRITLRNTTDRAHSIHLHGITSLAQGMDGVPHTSQAVLPGQSFSYAFVATDAGTHMYHCHVETNLHLDMGMYGALIVEPRDKPIWAKDHVLMLDEWDSHQDPDVIPHRTNPNYFLVNGRSYPLIPDLQIPQGEVHLIRLLNIGQEVHSMHLHGMTFLVVAKDGQDLPLPYRADTVLIAPGERYDLLVKGRTAPFRSTTTSLPTARTMGWTQAGYTSWWWAAPSSLPTAPRLPLHPPTPMTTGHPHPQPRTSQFRVERSKSISAASSMPRVPCTWSAAPRWCGSTTTWRPTPSR